MERLIYSNPIPSKLCYNSPIQPRLARAADSLRRLGPSSPTTAFPLPKCAEPRRVNPLCCSLSEPCFVSTKHVVDDCPEKNSSSNAGSANGSEPNCRFLKLIAQIMKLSQQHKVFNTVKVILTSAILLTSLHQAIVLPALATFPDAAAKAGPGLFQSELLTSAWAGLFAGCLHTLSGPDHLAALAPLSIGRTKLESAAVGALWGCGHDAGQMIFGLLFLLLKDKLHIEVIRTWGTRVVGLTLLVIGAMGIREASEAPAPCAVLENGECEISGYEDDLVGPPVGKKKKKIGLATFATGIVHGLQPDALMMILPALALPSRVAGAAFLSMFLVGTVVAMGSYTVFIGSFSEALKDKVPRITEKLTWASSLIAIGLGFAILISQFFGFSLY